MHSAMASHDSDGDLVLPRRRTPQLQLPTNTSVDAAALVQLIQSGVVDVRGETVVELACGACAAASIAAARCGARHVYATDGGGDGNHSLRGAAANAKNLVDESDTVLSVRRLDVCELPRLLRVQPEEEAADADALDLDWTAADLRELRGARMLLGGSRLLGPPPANPELEAGPAKCAAALLQACRTWAAGGTASAAAEVEARRWLSGGGGSAGSAADAEAVAVALSAVLQDEAEGGARTLLLAVEVERDDDGTSGVGEADAEAEAETETEAAHGFRWRSEAPPPRLGARLRSLMASGLEARWAPASSWLRGHCHADVFVLRVRACEGSTSRKRPRHEVRQDSGDDDDDDEIGGVPASSPYYGYAVAPGAAPPARGVMSHRCVQLGGVFGRDAIASLDVMLRALDRGGSPRDTTPGFKRATTECLHYGPATAWLFAPVVAALERALAVLGGGPASATAGGRRVEWVTALQYNRYEVGDHFEQLHLDEIAGPTAYKEVSIVVFLSDDAADYRGGRFEVGQPPPAPNTRTLDTPANSAVVFSAQHVAHRVTRVEAGCRRSLVAWATARDVSQQYEQCSRFADVLAACPMEGNGPSLISCTT